MDSISNKIQELLIEKGIEEVERKAFIQQLQVELRGNKYGLVWENKVEKVSEQLKTHIPYLTEVKEKRLTGSPQNETHHLLIEGDNLEALTLLQTTHKGGINICYIDPPYNTGNKDFVYNDHIVDKEDAYRHSKWLSFMEKRLTLAYDLLSDDGVVFISIDDNEFAQLKLLCDKIFDNNNVEIMVWHKVGDDSGRLKITKRFRREHEYIIVCYKNKDSVFFSKYEAERNYKNEYTNPDKDARGPYNQGIISHTEAKSNPNGKNFYSVTTPSGRVVSRQWRVSEDEFNQLRQDNRIYFGKNGDSIPSLKVFISEKKMATPISILSDLGTAKSAGKGLNNILHSNVFNYPKPIELIKHLLKISSHPNSVILDFFAGSGTTGHAVLELNQEDGGNRQFILCTNNENNICEEVTFERLSRVINGYVDPKGKFVEGIAGNMDYYKVNTVPKVNNSTDNAIEYLTKGIEIIGIKENAFNRENFNDYCILSNRDKVILIYLEPFVLGHEVIEISKKLKGYEQSQKIIYSTMTDVTVHGVEVKEYPQEILEQINRIQEILKQWEDESGE